MTGTTSDAPPSPIRSFVTAFLDDPDLQARLEENARRTEIRRAGARTRLHERLLDTGCDHQAIEDVLGGLERLGFGIDAEEGYGHLEEGILFNGHGPGGEDYTRLVFRGGPWTERTGRDLETGL